jgi:hypothetical protein
MRTQNTSPYACAPQLVAPMDIPVRIWREADGSLRANVPRTVIEHSPTGFECGYGGSGPADLALNILNAFVPPRDAHDRVKCFRGHCSGFAWIAERELEQ